MKSLADARDRNELLQRLRTVRPDSLPRWGRMTAHQMVCHLADAFRMMTDEKPVRPRTNLLTRTVLKQIVLLLPARWPPGIPTSPELDQTQGGSPPHDFASDVAQLVTLVEHVEERARQPERRPHPLFGAMSEAEWLRWGYLHMDHHLRQFGA